MVSIVIEQEINLMISLNNLKTVLETLDFTKENELYVKKFCDLDTTLAVDFVNKKLIYPELLKGRTRNAGFDKPENFVVFECVNRLFEKGYRPEHIELEKEWHLGHNSKSGRADICVTDASGTMLMIIECKTWGSKFDKALKDTKADGAQLFSYWQQEQATKWLVLYASNYDAGEIQYKAPTINCTDDNNIIELSKKDATIQLYKNAKTTKEKHTVWTETYLSKIYDELVFSNYSVAYQIGVKPLFKKDLRDFSPDDKIVNTFEEILRHNNVSDKENAFNRLVALFICKLVDEITKSEEDEVEFQYKQGTDTYETLQDRLQRLHKDGMEKFMREEIYYVSDDYAENLVKQYTGQKRKNMIQDLKETIRILKYYTNNDFAFKDVHNEDLFYQNGKILVEMVQLFEKYRIVYPSKHQFLGDLFEQLLNKGFKQDEGQFFTPTPITRFIWDSLPIKQLMKSEKTEIYPKVIDYACGAGHFLTEAVETINYYSDSLTDNNWVRDHIFGIEKDYRLARVAKISMFMNGAGESNIMFADGLENSPDKKIENNSFDILVANPPYSVKDFKQHLDLKNNSFELLERIGKNGSEIEVLFVERIAQLLKPQGIAAVILPSSILSNDSSSYTGAREIILKNFHIKAIVSLGSKTFAATGTNTVIMFLEKYNEPPKNKEITWDTVESIFNGSDVNDWSDKDILEAYIAQIDVDSSLYIDFLYEHLTLESLSDNIYFKAYIDTFNNSSTLNNLKKSSKYKALSPDKKDKEYLLALYSFIKNIEKEKVYYFALVYGQNTVVIKSPNGKKSTKKQEQFLGYKWSNRKGNEGIQIITPGGKMFDDSNRDASGTLAYAIRQSFTNYIPQVNDDLSKYFSVLKTVDMFDFSSVNFNKDIVPSGKRRITITTRFPVTQLSNIASDIEKGKSITQDETVFGKYKVVAGGVDYAYMHNQFNRDANIITISASGANAGFVNYWNEKIFASDCTTIKASDTITTKWVYYYLKLIQPQIFEILQKGSGQPHVYPDDIKLIPIPDINNDLQEEIVNECEKITKKCNLIKAKIDALYNDINAEYTALDSAAESKGTKMSLRNKDDFEVSIGSRVLDKQLIPNGKIPVYSANVIEPFGKIDKLLVNDFSLDSVLWGIDGDWMVSFMPKDTAFYPTDHCGYLRVKTDAVHPKYLAHLLQREGEKAGFSRTYRASIERVEGISFSVPSISKQNKAIKIVEGLEKKISKLNKEMNDLQGKTNIIVRNYIE